MVKKWSLVALFAILFMVCATIQLAEPVSAAKVYQYKVDQGTKYFYSGQSGPMKLTWKTYAYSNTYRRKVYKTFYVKIGGKYVVSWHEIATLQKISKTRMKISEYSDSELGPGTTVSYKKTGLSTRKYYWHKYRPTMLKNL